MSDEPKRRSRAWLWVAIGLLLGYPLSIGPVGIIAHKCGCLETVMMVYRPLFWAGEQFPPLGGLIFFYWALWRAIGRSLLS
ncbi:MAG TPA: hypothetical protein VG055_26150 [Planctomycetaceae bacterium]|jgi:hypothetical protein|nr:hypothetical protein [Planctomycetaceae bacterium]